MKISKFQNVLSKTEMKNIRGGNATCGFKYTYQGYTYFGCNVEQSFAMSQAAEFGGYWCCASCASSSYCGS